MHVYKKKLFYFLGPTHGECGCNKLAGLDRLVVVLIVLAIVIMEKIR